MFVFSRRKMGGGLLCLLLFLSGCASTKTRQDQYLESEPLAQEGRYAEAVALIEESKEKSYKEKDRVLYWLDLGMLYHWGGEYEKSNQVLTQAEFAIEEMFTKSISAALISGALNDNALDYWGEDYEDLYINVFKGLNYIALGDEEAALVEMRRLQIKQNLLEDKYKKLVEEYNADEESGGTIEAQKNPFHNAALARYLSLLLYRFEGSLDDARIDSQKIEEAWRDQAQLYRHPMPPLPQLTRQEGQALVDVVAFTGRNPIKLAETFLVNSGKNTIFLSAAEQSDDYVTSLTGFSFLLIPGVEPGLHFKYQFPRLNSRGSEVDRLVFKVDGEPLGEIPLFENIDVIAQETFKVKQPLIVGRTLIRSTIKNITKELGKDAAQDALTEEYGGWGLLTGAVLGIAADIAVNATENADLRISHFFPAYAHAREFAVTPGTYQVTLEYWSGNNLLMTADHGSRTFTERGLNFVESHILR